ncbi:hypothetical protein SAMN04488570_1902 [Nocardioides scoriae]|uniref:ARB-07466-like C-terminal domain-containing protein n=1 Tax=Nocardioides scoriae TaxID=642780 RepID=A0A1H1SAM8_9ACTN|nr:hypothetical protein [Nocardioides scoriae]SDS44838.1 hypothetical protein SAMN04488570_1902 [Nocardioides scoriae]
MRRSLSLLPLAVVSALLVVGPTTSARADEPDPPPPVEAYAKYDPQSTCSPKAKPGTVVALDYVVATYGGAKGGISRPCGGSVSEHKEGRAFDWTLDAAKEADRIRAAKLRKALFAEGPDGDAAELARRMGVMYIIWNDKMYASYRQFAPTPYVSSACKGKPLSKCSKTLRHRDHLHVSLSRAGGAGTTSWYAGRLPAPK